MRRIVVSFSLAVILLLVVSLVFGQGMNTPGEDGDDVLKKPLPEGASKGWFAAVQKDLAMKEYNLSPPADAYKGLYQAPNRAQGFRSFFSEKGVKLCPREDNSEDWRWGLEVIVASGLERRTKKESFKKPEITIRDNRIELDRGWLKEWFVNSPEGLEQGFTINSPQDGGGKLQILMELTGNLHPMFAGDGQRIDFYDSHNVSVISYSKLKVTDASGAELPARFTGVAGMIVMEIDDAGANYPVMVDPLITAPAWTAEGNQAEAYFGDSAATAGDVNGDGYSDIIIGAPGFDGGEADEGKAFVYHGSASGLSASPSWTTEGNQAGAWLGMSVATAGDVNGDGFSDVIIGANGYDNGQQDEGRALVFLGSASGLGGSPAWSAEGDQETANFGYSVSTAGDVNGDGFSDVIVGAWLFDNGQSDEGQAFVYLGSGSGLNSAPVWTGECDQAGASYGLSVGTAGDVNGDGFSDVAVGAPYFQNNHANEGRVFVYLGSASGPSAAASWMADGDQENGYFGFSVGPAGDVDGDGYSDVLIGKPGYNDGVNTVGQALLFAGGASGPGSVPSWTAAGENVGGMFGLYVNTAGDVNGDGYSDVVIGAPLFNSGEGAAFLYLGSASGLEISHSWSVEGGQGGARYADSLGTAGDVNGDGYSDMVVGAKSYDNGQVNEGTAYVYLGGPSGPSASPGWTADGDAANNFFAASVAPAGDVNGDGFADVIVGAYGFNSNTGKACLYLGSASGLSGSASWTATGESAGNYFGRCVASAGDVNGDGYSDVIIGADGFNGNRGKAYLYLGSSSGLAATESWTAVSSGSNSLFGCSAACAGDVNGDGFSDVIVGARGANSNRGRANLYLGSSSGLSAAESWTASGEATSNYFGCSVAAAGDINRDGFSDVIVGAYGYLSNTGRTYLYRGSDSGLEITASWTADGEATNNYFGGSVSTAGDTNGDGYSDVIVGAYGYNPGSSANTGKTYLCLGSASGLGTSASWTTVGNTANEYFGFSVAVAGDVNGDGYSDVAVGAYGYNPGSAANTGTVCLFLGSASGLLGGASWTASGSGANNYFGASVASSGDVNGDGYADLLTGAYGYNSSTGRASMFWGNGEAGRGLSLIPQQRRADDSAPIDRLGLSDHGHSFRLLSQGRTPFGRTKVKMEMEVKPLGTAFNGVGMTVGSSWSDTGVAGIELNEQVSGLTAAKAYHWRIRFLYDKGSTPFQQKSRWFAQPWAGWQETDLRTIAAVPSGLGNNTAEDIAVCQDTGISLAWPSDPSDWGDGGQGTRTYSILRGGSVIQSGIAYGTGTFTDTTGENGTSYLYQVRYTNGVGLSADTSGASAKDDFILPPGKSWVPLGSGFDGYVCALAWDGANLYAGGVFTTAGGVSANNIAKWNGTQWSPLGTGLDDIVSALAWDGANLYAGGWFTSAGGVSANHIAKWDGSQWTPLGSGTDFWVRALSYDSFWNELYAGGDSAGLNNNPIAKWKDGQWYSLDQLLDSSWEPKVFALQDDVNEWVGGDFDTGGTATLNNVGYWDFALQWWGSLDSGMNGAVRAFAQGETWKQVYSGGDFTTAGGIPANYVAKWDGTAWNTLGSGMDASVRSLLRVGTDIYAGGEFIVAGGAGANYIAKWDGSQWSPLGSGMTYHVYALAWDGADLYAGGLFSRAGGGLVNKIARWTADTPIAAPSVVDPDLCGQGMTITWNAVSGATGYDLQVDGATIVYDVTSPYTYYPGNLNSHTYRVRAKNPCGNWDWTAATSGADVMVSCIAPILSVNNSATDASACAGTGVTIHWNVDPTNWGDGGYGTRTYSVLRDESPIRAGIAYGISSFTDTTGENGVSYEYRVRYTNGAGLSSDTAGFDTSDVNDTPNTWNALGSGINGMVYATAKGGSNLYAAGEFTSPGNNIAKWDGEQWSVLGIGADSPVYALAWDGTNLYAGGDFKMVGGVAVSNIAKWNGSNWSALDSGISGSGQVAVRALAWDGTYLYAGGKFSSAGGVSVSNIARWQPGSPGSWSALGSGVDNDVYALACGGTNLYAGGKFSMAGGTAAANIAKWNGTGWSALGSGTGNWVYSLVWDGTSIFAGGKFNTAGGVAADYVAKWNGSSWRALGSGTNGIVNALAWSGTDLFAGGAFSIAGGQSASRIARWDGSSWDVLGSGLDSDVNALAWDGVSLFAGGIFSTAGNVTVNRIAEWTTPPSNLAAPSVQDQDSCGINVLISWGAAAGATGYDIKVDNAMVMTGVTSPRRYNPGDTAIHNYYVRAKNACGYWDWSPGTAASDTTGIAPPEIASGSSPENAQMWTGMVQSWPSYPGATGYRLFRGTKADLPNLLNDEVDFCIRFEGAETSFDCSADDPSGIGGACYYYLVIASIGMCDGSAGDASGGGGRQVNIIEGCTP